MKKGSKINKTIGEKYINKDGKTFEIIGYVEDDVRGRIIKFESGYTRRITTRSIHNQTNIIDIYTKKSIYGIAIMDIDNGTKHLLYWRWINMIGRCYNKNHVQYKSYGEKGYTVEDYLLIFSNYIKYIKSLPNYDKLKQNPELYEIDKDIKTNRKSTIYNRENISIVLKEDNLEEENKHKRIKVYQYDFEYNLVNDFNSIMDAERELKIDNRLISATCRNKQKSTGNFKFKYKNE